MPAASAYQYPGGVPGDQPWNRAALYIHRNVNKKSLTLDLDTDRGKQLFLKLATKCDVLVENYRASVMERLGLGHGVLAEVNPQLIYVKLSSQGGTGPERDYGSLGSTLEFVGGLASINGYEDEFPRTTNEYIPDPFVAMMSVGIIMAALRERSKNNAGSFVDVSQREATVNLLGEHILSYSKTRELPSPTGNRDPLMAPQGCYPCLGEDMWIAISVSSDEEWQGLCRAIGQPGLTRDDRFATFEDRQHNQHELDAIIAAWTCQYDHYQAMHLLQAHGVRAGAVLKGSEILSDPHLNARGFWDAVEHREVGIYKQVTLPWRLTKSDRLPATPAPALGEHNALVLSQLLGLSDTEIRELEEQEIIGTRPKGA
jgi:crotonobetainyl-CoA:carnitine CoA-transferase CaiB-like acyl-CoA transferase